MKKTERLPLLFSSVLFDICTIIVAAFVSLIILDRGNIQNDIVRLAIFLVYAIPALLITFALFGVYRQMWQFARVGGIIRILFSIIVFALLVAFIGIATNNAFDYAFYFLELFFVYFGCWAVRVRDLIIYKIKNYFSRTLARKDNENRRKVVFIGLEEATSILIQEYQDNKVNPVNIIGIIEENKNKHGLFSNGVKVIGDYSNIYEICTTYAVDEIIIISSNKEQLEKIIGYCKNVPSKIRILPNSDTIEIARLSNLRAINVLDLLGREEYRPNLESMSDLLTDKTILVTGGGGSIGSELCRQIIRYKPHRLIIFDIYENTTYDLYTELIDIYGFQAENAVKVIIGSILEEKTLDAIFETYSPDLVFHAAAYKHVPLMEYCPSEAVQNNIFGTYQVANLCGKYGTHKFLLISTDKAVNPTSVMGATKRAAEILVNAMQKKYPGTQFVSVRFGNVLGSNGSVFGHFQKQIERGGPVTITHPEINRYFMTISEAVSLVLEAMYLAKDGEIFVLDMGSPIKIDSLARKMIELAGLIPEVDIPIKYIGLRPGEKLYEEMLLKMESISQTENKKIYISQTKEYSLQYIYAMLDELKRALKNDGDLIEILKKYISTYKESTLKLKQNRNELEELA